MSVVYLLLPMSLAFGIAALVVFIWALKSGQFQDLHTPAHRILMEDASSNSPKNPPIPNSH